MTMQVFMPLYEVLQLSSVEDMIAAYDKLMDTRRKRRKRAEVAKQRTLESSGWWTY